MYRRPVSESPPLVPGRAQQNTWRSRLQPRPRADLLAARVEVPLLLLLASPSPTALPFAHANSQSPPCRRIVCSSCYHALGGQSAFLLLAWIPSLPTECRSVHVS